MGKKSIEALQNALDKINHLIKSGKVVIVDESKAGDNSERGDDKKEVG